MIVKLGVHDLTTNETESQTSIVEDIILHPDWNISDSRFDADIAIIVLRDPVVFTDSIQPICLPRFKREIFGQTGTIVGWGKSESSSAFETKPKKLEIPIISSDYCYTTFPRLAAYGSTRAFCGGYVNENKAPCHGDSGSGLFVKDRKYPFSWIIEGLVSGSLSIGSTCDVNKFSLYTDVQNFTTWISKTLEDTKEKVQSIDVFNRD